MEPAKRSDEILGGHEVEAGRLEDAARSDQSVERRQSQETAPDPVEAEGGTS